LDRTVQDDIGPVNSYAACHAIDSNTRQSRSSQRVADEVLKNFSDFVWVP